ncbi:MAG: helix-turn-helix transcriptional regulator [Haloplanus sp.]
MTDRSPAALVEHRLDTLRALRDAPGSKTTLVDRTDVSRSTVDRSLRDLSTVGFVNRTADGYRLTRLGELALDEHERRTRRIDAIADAASLFGEVDIGIDVDPAVFDGATFVEATPPAPHRPVERVRTLVEGATHVSVYAGRLLARHARIYHDRVVDEAMSGAFVATDGVLERLSEIRPEDLREAVDMGRVAVRLTGQDAPVTVILAETPDGPRMGLVAYRDNTPRGFVGNDDPAATRWARDFHARVWDAATPFDPRG